MRNGRAKGIVFVACALLVGSLVSFQFDRFLGISFTPKYLPVVPTLEANDPAEPFPDLRPVEAISVPAGSFQDELYRRAAFKLAEAVQRRSGSLPKLQESPVLSHGGRIIAIGYNKPYPVVKQRG